MILERAAAIAHLLEPPPSKMRRRQAPAGPNLTPAEETEQKGTELAPEVPQGEPEGEADAAAAGEGGDGLAAANVLAEAEGVPAAAAKAAPRGPV